jgi:hypothetical protein
VEERYELKDDKVDILSHRRRRDQIHILSVDPVLATDIYERIHHDKRLKRCELIRAHATRVRDAVDEIYDMAQDTVSSRLLVFDVRRVTMPKLHKSFNTIVGYNRRDFNKLCYTIVIGDGPVGLFRAGKVLDAFVPHLAAHRVDYHPAVFFYDPFLHYEIDEREIPGIDEQFVLPDSIPRRLVPYFREGQDVGTAEIRRFFRAIGKPEDVRKERLRTLRSVYKKRIAEQFPHHKDQLRAWLSREGIRLATEKLHLYPLFFEDWVYDLIRKARKNAAAPRRESE